MNHKILLRKPRCVIHEDVNNLKIVNKSECSLTSFKEDIQPEIEELDRQYEESQNNNLNTETQVAKYENLDVLELKSKSHNDFHIVSLCNIDEGLLPLKDNISIKKREISNKIRISKKTIKAFEATENISTNDKTVFYQNIFEQIEKGLPVVNKSIPKHIAVIELAALLKSQFSDHNDKRVSCKIKNLPKLGSIPSNLAPKYEIILYENDDIPNAKSILPNKTDGAFNCKADYNQKTIAEEEVSDEISPISVSMMECFMTGKQCLNLSAHAISKLPNIADVFQFLSLLNLSYNNFRLIPEEIYQLKHLDYLNVKNNPIQILDESILHLTALRVLVCSFTLISNIPSSLFRCENLEQVDLSYNNITFVPHVEKVFKIKVLNLSGNPIRYFKKSFTQLNLESLGLENTFIHPVFWKQDSFLDDCENSWAFCDLCDQIIVDFSINLLAFTRKFNYVLPLLLSFCSSLCRDSAKSK